MEELLLSGIEILTEMIARGNILHSDIQELSKSIWNKKKLPQQ
jgi:hypothetical protein